ncbi:unnamed protein product [Boreogadus saida]
MHEQLSTEKGSLRSHMKIHCGEKPFVCLLCYASFSHPRSVLDRSSVYQPTKLTEVNVAHLSSTDLAGYTMSGCYDAQAIAIR